jgi:hypothetical protein
LRLKLRWLLLRSPPVLPRALLVRVALLLVLVLPPLLAPVFLLHPVLLGPGTPT